MQRRIGILRRRRIARRNPEQGKRREPQDGARETWHASSFRPRGPSTPCDVQVTGRLPTSREPRSRVGETGSKGDCSRMPLMPQRRTTPGLIEVNSGTSRPRAPVSGGRLLFEIDDALTESVDAERDQRFVADNTEDIRAIGRQYDLHAGF